MIDGFVSEDVTFSSEKLEPFVEVAMTYGVNSQTAQTH